MEAALGDVPRWIEADLAFHGQIAAMSHNALVALQMQGLEPVVREMMGRFNDRAARTTADWRETYERHVRIADAIAAGDADAAERGDARRISRRPTRRSRRSSAGCQP